MNDSRTVVEMKAGLRSALQDVNGWLDLTEAWALHETARTLPMASPVIVEVGSYHGRSTIALALGAKSAGHGGKVFAVDPQQNEPDQLESFLANIERTGLGDRVELIRTYSHEARGRFADASVDVLFLDGAHNFGAVVEDIDDWRSALRDGAVIAFNDAIWLDGVRLALLDRVVRERTPFRNPRWSYNTLFFDYLPAKPWTAGDRIAFSRVRWFLVWGGRWNKLHSRLIMNKKVPEAVKGADFALMLAALGVILPRSAARL